jgi:hypothetical protein
LVVVPAVVPKALTDAPTTGSLVELSKILPFIRFWAKEVLIVKIMTRIKLTIFFILFV